MIGQLLRSAVAGSPSPCPEIASLDVAALRFAPVRRPFSYRAVDTCICLIPMMAVPEKDLTVTLSIKGSPRPRAIFLDRRQEMAHVWDVR